MDTYYDTLEVSETASEVVIKAAYKYLSQRNHPDRGGDPERQKALNEAYRILSDPEERALYDEWLAAERTCIDLEEDIVQRAQADAEPEGWEADSRPVKKRRAKKRGNPWWLRVAAGLVALPIGGYGVLMRNDPGNWASEYVWPWVFWGVAYGLLSYALQTSLFGASLTKGARGTFTLLASLSIAAVAVVFIATGDKDLATVVGVITLFAVVPAGLMSLWENREPRTSKKHGVRKT